MTETATIEAAAQIPGAGARKVRPARFRSKLTDGRILLPGVNSQSKWARLFRDMLDVNVPGLKEATNAGKMCVFVDQAAREALSETLDAEHGRRRHRRRAVDSLPGRDRGADQRLFDAVQLIQRALQRGDA